MTVEIESQFLLPEAYPTTINLIPILIIENKSSTNYYDQYFETYQDQ